MLSSLKHFFKKRTSKQRVSPHHSRAYFDNAGATTMSDRALSSLHHALSSYGNASALHKEGVEASLLLDKARATIATIVNVHAYELYFLSSGTESVNEAILGTYNAYIRNNKGSIPHIITSNIEHPAVKETLAYLQKEHHVEMTEIQVNHEGVVSPRDVEEAIKENTILVTTMYANNEIGTIQPIKEIGRALDAWKKKMGRNFTSYPYFHTDACQAPNYLSCNVLSLKVHMMSVNSGKVYGPKGVAALYIREGTILDAISYGGGQERKLRSGTEAVAFAYSFAQALQEATDIQEKESIRVAELRDLLKDILHKNIPDIIFYGAFDIIKKNKEGKVYREWKRLPNNLNVGISFISSEEMILRLDALGYAVSHKSACASQEDEGSYVIQALGASVEESKENIRITLGKYSTEKEVRGLAGAIMEVCTKYRVKK